MHKVRWSVEALAIGAMLFAQNFYMKALNPAISAQSAMSQLNSDVTSQVEVVGYQNVLYLAGWGIFLITASIVAYEGYSWYKEKKEKKDD